MPGWSVTEVSQYTNDTYRVFVSVSCSVDKKHGAIHYEQSLDIFLNIVGNAVDRRRQRFCNKLLNTTESLQFRLLGICRKRK